jgi:hypothetical protein
MEMFFGIATVVLALGIAYGWFRYATRDRSKDQMTEDATRREYDRPTRDDKSRPA